MIAVYNILCGISGHFYFFAAPGAAASGARRATDCAQARLSVGCRCLMLRFSKENPEGASLGCDLSVRPSPASTTRSEQPPRTAGTDKRV